MIAMPDQDVSRYSTRVLLKHLNAFEQEIDGVYQAKDIEHIHRMRVATRRLRTALAIFSDSLGEKTSNAWRKEFRRVTLALGASRDTDVQIACLQSVLAQVPEKYYQTGIRRLILRLTQKRNKLQGGVEKALGQIQSGRTLKEMRGTLEKIQAGTGADDTTRSPSLYQLAYISISTRLDKLLSYEVYVYRPECVAELHAMRIAAKRLRYTMEIFAPVYRDELKSPLQTARQIQEALGNIHDCDVWMLFLEQFMEDERKRVVKYTGSPSAFNLLYPGLRYFLEDRQKERERIYTEFVHDWHRWQADRIWENLRQNIRLPLVPEVISPPSQDQ